MAHCKCTFTIHFLVVLNRPPLSLQVYGGLIIESNIVMRKVAGEIFDASPTIAAMGREAEFSVITNNNFYKDFQLGPLIFASLGRSNFYGMILDTVWAAVSMTAVISMRGKMSGAVAVAIYNQLEELNQLVGYFFSYNDLAAQTLP